MLNSTWPAFTSLPSRNRRFCTTPVTRARTWAMRVASMRPGSSVLSGTLRGCTVTTPTCGGGVAGAAPPAAGASAGLPQPTSASTTKPAT